MDQRRIGGGRTTRKPRIRPLGMSMKRWKTMLRKRVGRRGTRTLRQPVTFGRSVSQLKNQMMENIAATFNTKTGTKSKPYSYRTLRKMSSKFRKSLKSVSRMEKSRLSKIAEEHNLPLEELEDHIDTIVERKLTEIRDLPIIPGANAATVTLMNRLHNKAQTGLDYGIEASNPDYTPGQQKSYRKKFRDALKKAYIIQKTHEGGGDEGFGKEQGTLAYHEYMQGALIDRIHRERPDIRVNALAEMMAGIL